MALSITVHPYDRDMIARTAIGEAPDDEESQRAVIDDIFDKQEQGGHASPSDAILARGNYESWNNPRDNLRIDSKSKKYQRVAQMVDDASSKNDIGVILKGYGVTPPTEPPLGVTPAERAADITGAPPGKVPAVEEAPVQPTPQESAMAGQRGLGMQFVGSIPIAGPAINALTAAGSVQPGTEPWSERYMKAFQTQARADKYYAQQYPLVAGGAQFAGGALGYGGLGLTGPGRAALGMLPNLPIGTRLYAGAGGGAIINALDAAARGENPIPAAEIGAVGGLAGPLMSTGAEAATRAVAQNVWPRPSALRNIPRPGINLLTNALEGETGPSIAAARTRMGPAGFFGDINPALTDITGGIADIPGPGKAIVRGAYQNRAAEQGARIDAALTRAMGPTSNIVDATQFLTEARKAAADPLYEQWRTMQVHPTKELQALIPRLEKAGAFDEAESLSGISGDPINRNFFVGGPRKDFPTTQSWDYVKRGLDSKIEQAYSSGNNTKARELLKLKGEMIDEIEKTPAGLVWKQARSEFADRSALIDQINAGRDTFIGGRSGLSVDELREELRHLSGPELAARIQGARAAASEAMGDSIRGDTTLRNKMLAGNNQQKLRLLLQNDPEADRLISSLQSERYLSEQYQNVVGGSQTTPKAQRTRMFEPPQIPDVQWNVLAPSTYPGAAYLNPRNVLQSIINDRYARTAPTLARIMTERDPNRITATLNALTAERDRLANVSRITTPFISGHYSIPNALAGGAATTYRRQIEKSQP